MNKNKLGLFTILTLLLFSAYVIFQHQYQSLNHAKTVDKIEDYRKDHKIGYEFYYRNDCSDCNTIKTDKLVKELHTKKVLAINTKQFDKLNEQEAQRWFKENHITHTPTLIVTYDSKPIYVYSGTNQQKIIDLLNNKDLKYGTNIITYQNDFTKTKTQIK